MVPASVVSSAVVVVGEVGVEVLSEAGDGGFGVSKEGGLVELFEDGALDSFDFPVGLGSAGFDVSVFNAEAFEGVAEELGSVFVAVVGGGGVPVPSPLGEVVGDAVGEL